MKNFSIFFLLLIPVILSSCSAAPNLDRGLLQDNPCKAPCWNGLTPGQSTAADVDQFVQDLDPNLWKGKGEPIVEVNGCTLENIADRPGIDVTSLIRFHVLDGSLTYILSTHPDMPDLKDIVDHYGSPEYVEALNVVGPDGSFYSLEIFYPSLGLAFQVSVEKSDLGQIRENMKVSDIEVFESGQLMNYYLAKYGCSVGTDGAKKNGQKSIDKYIHPWPGFGSVDVVVTR